MRAIVEGSGTLVDPAVVEAFCRVVAPFPAGTEVELSDGRTGLVVSVPDEALDRPLVRVIGTGGAEEEVSLLDDLTLGIKGWEHQPFTSSPVSA